MAAKKSSPLKIIPLGGLDGIGKNMTVFECGDDMVLVDAGLMFPDDKKQVQKLQGVIINPYYELCKIIDGG